MNHLIEKLRKTRQTDVVAGKFTYTIRRPTDLEIASWAGEKDADILKAFTVGWKGVEEIDIIPGGGPIDVPFDIDLFMEFIADRPDDYSQILTAIVEAYRKHIANREDAKKK